MNIKEWLHGIGLENYLEIFYENHIDEESLLTLTREDLREMGITSVGHLKKILTAIEKFKDEELKNKEIRDEEPPKYSPWDISNFPTIIAQPLKEYLEEVNPVLKLWYACEAIELLLKLVVVLGLAEISRDGKVPKEVVSAFSSRIEEPTLGKWKGMATDVIKYILKRKVNIGIPEILELVNDILVPLLDGEADQKAPENSFSALRNQLAHGSGMTKKIAEKLLSVWRYKFEEAIDKAWWLKDLSFIILDKDKNFRILIGSSNTALPYSTDDPIILGKLKKAFEHGEEIVLVRGKYVLPIWPLTLYGIPRSPDPGVKIEEPAPQVYIRRGEVRLQFTPIGSDELCQSVSDEPAMDSFRLLFRLDENIAQKANKAFEICGFESDIHKDSSQLVGRSEELVVIRKAITSNLSQVYWLTGPAGIGKSYLVARVADELLNDPPKNTLILPYRFKAGDDRCTRSKFLRFAIERILAWGKLKLEDDDQSSRKNQKKAIEEIKELLSYFGDKRLIFILDGLDEIAEKDPKFAKEIPLGLSFPGVTWFCAGRPERGLPEIFSSDRCHHIFPDGVPMMSSGDIRIMLLENIGKLRKDLLDKDKEKGDKIVNPFIEKVARCANGLPMYVAYLIRDIQANRFMSMKVGEQLPPSIDAYHEELLQRCLIGTLHQLLTPLAVTLAISEEPLTPQSLKSLLKRRTVVKDDELGLQLLNQGLSAIASMLCRATTPEGKEGYSLYHNSLRQHMLRSDRTRYAVELAQIAMCDAALSVTDDAVAPYLYRHGITHLIESDRRNDAVSLLTDFKYLMSRLRTLGGSAGVHGISDDWKKIIDSGDLTDDVAIWEEFWRMKEHSLIHSDDKWQTYKILLQLAHDHADESPLTKATEDWIKQRNYDWAWMQLDPYDRPKQIPKSACLFVLEGHKSYVHDCVLSEDGKFAASVSGSLDYKEYSLRIWNLESRECVKIMTGHTAPVMSVSVTLDWKIAVTGSRDMTVRIWNIVTGECIGVFDGHKDKVLTVVISPDGKQVLSGSADGRKYVITDEGGNVNSFNIRTGICHHDFKGHHDFVRSASFSADGRFIVTGSDDHSLRIWNFEDGECLTTMHFEQWVIAARFLGPNYRCIIGLSDGNIQTVDLVNGPTPGIPIVSAVRIWLFDPEAAKDADITGKVPGKWDKNITAGCVWCGKRFVPANTVFDAIYGITSHLTPEKSPCMELPDEAWEESHLVSECIFCHNPVKFNPFIVDNREKLSI